MNLKGMIFSFVSGFIYNIMNIFFSFITSYNGEKKQERIQNFEVYADCSFIEL